MVGTGVRQVASTLVLAWVALLPPAAAPPSWSRPREMPSLLVRWQRGGEPCALAARDGVVYVLEPGRVAAVDGDGRTRWEHRTGTQDCPFHWQGPLLLLDELVVVAVEDRLIVIDRATGARRHALPLGGDFATMWGPPVLAEAGDGERRELISVDPAAGRITARQRFRSGVYDVQVAGTVALVHSQAPSVTALRLPGLSPLWTADGFSGVGLVAGRSVLARRVEEGDCSFDDLFPVDAESGRLGPRLFRRSPSQDRQRPPGELEFVEGQAGHSVRRVEPSDGRLLWEAVLPGEVTAWHQQGARLYAHCSGTGRGFLVVLDAVTGKVLQAAYGLRDVYRLEASGGQIFLLAAEGVVAAASDEFGPPEATTLPVAEAVRRILAAPMEGWELEQPEGDLEALGPEALPALAEEVARLAGLPLAVAAARLADAGYLPAAPALARRLGALDAAAPDAVAVAVLDALAVLGGPSEADAAGAVLTAPGRSEEVKLHAFMALVGIGTPEALASATRALEERRARGLGRFTPPSSAAFRELVGKPVDEEARARAVEREDFAEWGRLGRGAESASATLPAGRSMVVFPDGRLGNQGDLWAQEVGRDGVLGESIFLGGPVPGPPCEEGCAIEAAVHEGTLSVRRKGLAANLRVELAAARRDSDGDGLTDHVEARLGTDPSQGDSDGDGIADAADPLPGSALREPVTEADQVNAAIFEQFHLFDEATAELAVFVGAAILPATGRRGPTLVVEPAALKAFKAERGLSGAAFITIGPSDGDGAPIAGEVAAYTGRSGGRARVLDPRDRVYEVSIYRGPLSAAGYEVVVRKTERGWLIRSLRQTWVS